MLTYQIDLIDGCHFADPVWCVWTARIGMHRVILYGQFKNSVLQHIHLASKSVERYSASLQLEIETAQMSLQAKWSNYLWLMCGQHIRLIARLQIL